MDIPAAAAGPWIALGVVAGVLLLGLAGLVATAAVRRRSPVDRHPSDGPPVVDAPDDLADFLEHPPGTEGARRPPAHGWATLTAPAPVPAPAPPPPDRATRAVLTAMAVAALVLVGAAAALAAGDQRNGDAARPATTSAPPSREPEHGAVEARLSFGGVVLEPHAVGVTVTYPELLLSGETGHLRARVDLPTWNCLTGEAPADPGAAGCRRTGTEVGELTEPDLVVLPAGDGLQVSGRLPTSEHPSGSEPEPTGRAYRLVVTLAPGGPPSDRGWRPAEGTLQLGEERTATTGTDTADGVNVLRFGDR